MDEFVKEARNYRRDLNLVAPGRISTTNVNSSEKGSDAVAQWRSIGLS